MKLKDRMDGFKKLGVFLGAVAMVWATAQPVEVKVAQTVYLAIGYLFGQGIADAGKYFNGRRKPEEPEKKAKKKAA